MCKQAFSTEHPPERKIVAARAKQLACMMASLCTLLDGLECNCVPEMFLLVHVLCHKYNSIQKHHDVFFRHSFVDLQKESYNLPSRP